MQRKPPLLASPASSAGSTKTSLVSEAECRVVPAFSCTTTFTFTFTTTELMLESGAPLSMVLHKAGTDQTQWIAKSEGHEVVGSVGLESKSLRALCGIIATAVPCSPRWLPHGG